MSNKNKQKGNYLEEFVAKMFQKQFNLDKRDVHRAQSSGVFSTEYGDLYFRKHAIIIECKNQQDVQLQRIFPKISETIYKFQKQLDKDVKSFKDKYPNQLILSFLVLTNSSNRLPKYCIMSESNLTEYIKKEIISEKILISSISLIKTKYQSDNYFVFILEDLIKYINLEILEF